MKSFTFRIVFYAFVFSFLISCHKKHKKSAKYDNIQKLMEQEFERTKDPLLNVVPTDRLLEAIEVRDAKLNAVQTLSGIQSVNTAVSGITWQERGPGNVGGRTRALWFDLSDAANGYKKVWAGGVGGGLWYTNDITVASPVWNKVNDALENIAISCFVQSTTNPQIMYFGTGEGWENVDAVRGLGIWKTMDGGANWTRLTSTSTFYFIQDLLIDNNGHLYAALRSNDQGGGSVGIQKSTDGGNTWTQVLDNSFAKSSRGADLELAANGDIYASMGTVTSNGGIYRSIFATHTSNTGNSGTWTNITPNAAGTITDPNNFWQRIEIACAPSDANTVYALFMGHGSNYDNCESIQRYNAASNSWTACTVPTIVDQGSGSVFTRFQTFYNLIAAVDPNNANSLYIGGVDALRSKDGGSSWDQMTTWSLAGAVGFTPNQNVHADHHAIQFAPGSSSRAIWGTDGGVYYTSNANINGAGNKPTFTSKSSGYNVTQYYSVAMHPSNSNYFLAGAQDNGTHKFSSSGINNVSLASGGDGGLCHIDRDDPSIQISSYVLNNYYVSTDGGINFVARSKNDRGRFINPTDYDDAANILYCGDSAKSFFRWTNPAADGTAENVLVSAFGNSAVTHVAVSPSTVNRVYFGLANGSVVRVDNANSGTSLTGTVVKTGTGWVSCIAVDPANEDHMLVTYSNYGAAMVNVFESTNALAASPVFTSVEGDLPDMPVRWAMFDPRNSDWALLATELGVWSTDNLNAGATTNWSPTNSGLANVRVDMLQYRTSDQTIVAATHGRGLFTAVLPPVTTPDINFNTSTTSATEQTTNTSGCRTYTDYSVLMSIKNAPTGNADVTVNIQGGGTATLGLDYDYTTNGNFTSSSNTVVFTNSAVETKTVTIRVYNDAEVESSETFIMSYSIGGTTNAQAGIGAQTHVVTIEDNDITPHGSSSSTHTVGTGGFLTTSPFDATLQSKKTHFLYKASELTAAGITAGDITSIAFNINKQSSRPYQNMQIKMGATSVNYLVDGSASVVSVNTVKSLASYSTVNGWNTFMLDVPFSWNGTSNIVVELCYDNGSANGAQTADQTFGFKDGGTVSQGNTFYQNNINCAGSFSSVVYYPEGFKPQARFEKTSPGTSVASAVVTRSEYFAASNDLYFYNSTGEILARVKNLSSHNYGCMDVILDRAGTGATAFWNNNTANRIMNKTFRIIPTNNNASGLYQITLYYSQAEVAGWEAATGQSFNNIQLIKTAGQISAVTPASANAAGTIEIVTPVRGTFGSNYTLTYTFNDGFSGFGAGIAGAALPITLLDFVGQLKQHNIVLDWKTSFESNSSGFEIERSYDGNNFTKIGFLKAAGNSSITRSYTFTDKEITQINNYYRLRQVDLDGKFTYSKVIVIKNAVTAKMPFTLLNNPVQSSIDIQFGETGEGTVQVRLTDVSGKLIKAWNGAKVANRRVRIDITDRNLSKGVYILHASVNGKEYSEKVIVK
ncbi:MAG TPA: T9SS type A sorting domain-containing protein [Flavitalea sp.]|nr:T9SS type A sorting domain-containing protein [Flavitalea sp.]